MTDVRTHREKLPPDAFACAGPDLPPRDIIEKDVWYSIMSLPDDVSLRTSDNHGTVLKYMRDLWSSIIFIGTDVDDIITYPLLDASEELMACMVNSVIGFYRVAASCLRSALELVVKGAYFQRCKNLSEYNKWRESRGEIKYGEACNHLNKLKDVKSCNDYLYDNMKDSLFDRKNRKIKYEGGWARNLHSRLSDFVHSRVSYTSVDMWKGSNGPIYVPESLGKIYALYCDTSALIYALIKIARPKFGLPKQAKLLFDFPVITPSQISFYTYEYFWGGEFIKIIKNQMCDLSP